MLLASSSIFARTASATFSALAPDCRKIADADGGLAVDRDELVVALRAELEARDVLQAQHAAGPGRAQDDVAELLRARPGGRCAVTV